MTSAAVPGFLIARRFTLETLVGKGGMGNVYRARDASSDRPVAVKLLHSGDRPQDARRFAREAALLSELRHPGIVTYLAHGETEDGQPYLAMEWLDGEDLASRLSRGPLPLPEALTLLRRVAEALAVAHDRGVVHRDLKPSNLFLREGQVDRVALLDFGIARHAAVSHEMTAANTILGTLQYMAPEQARGERQLTPAADVFGLGCVLFECLTGQRPFDAERAIAVLGRILFVEPPRLRKLRPEMPETVEALLERMLAKDTARRLQDAAAVLAALDARGDLLHSDTLEAPSVSGEQQLLSVLIAVPPSARRGAPPATNATLASDDLAELRRELADEKARLEVLADGSLVATLRHTRGAATDQATRAARCALLIRARWPGAVLALGTGRGRADESAPVGEVFDRAAALLRDHAATGSTPILLDQVTRGLLEVRFVVQQTPSGTYVLTGEELALDASRPLLGKPTPCVGRDAELMMLESALAGCIAEAEPRAVVVTAPPGAGKSRLRHELLRRLSARGEDISLLIGRGESLTAGSAYGLLSQALRRLCGILDGDLQEVQRDKLARRIGEVLPDAERGRVIVFLGELCGVPFPDDDDVKLRAARQVPQIMSDRIAQAMLDFLRAEAARRPVLLVLEDLHWGDALTVKLCDLALRELRDCPLLVLALARPEVDELFPRLWGGSAQVIPLRPLGKKAGERLVQQVLGQRASPVTVARIVEQSEGNALFLEELIRAEAEGRGDEAPATVLAMLQARIGRLDSGARRVLRAASVFGEAARSDGILAVLEESMSSEELGGWLARLFQTEILEERRDSRFPGEKKVWFHHALMRDAAYGLLLDADRAFAHRMAGAYLEASGERDPLVLAEHYQLGGALDHAVRCYVRAATELFDRHDMPGVLRCFEAGVACSAGGAALGLLSALRASAYFWLDDPERACSAGGLIVPQLPDGSYPWCRLVGALLLSNAALGKQEAVAELGRLLLATDPADDARTVYVEATGHLHNMSTWFGLQDQARACLAQIDAASAPILARDAIGRGWACLAHSFHDHFFGHRPSQAWRWAKEGTDAFRQAGDERSQVGPEIIAGLAAAAMGDEERAEVILREALACARRVGQPFPISYAQMHLAFVLGGSDRADRREEAAAIAREWVHPGAPSMMFQGIAHEVLARVAARRGDPGEALEHARTAGERLRLFWPYRLFALATLSAVQLALGRPEDAKDSAAPGVEVASRIGGTGEIPLRLALAEALHASANREEARAALEDAVQRLRLRLADIQEPAARERFLTSVPANARVVALANEWLGLDVE